MKEKEVKEEGEGMEFFNYLTTGEQGGKGGEIWVMQNSMKVGLQEKR